MNSVALIQYQLSGLHDEFHHTVGDMSASEWVARVAPGHNLVGFLAWHIPSVQDLILHIWIHGEPEMRTRPEWADRLGMDVSPVAFGMPLKTADTLAHTVTPMDVLAYADAIHNELMGWLRSCSDADLDRVPPAFEHLARYPDYQAMAGSSELEGMWDYAVWQLLVGTCIGHLRGHLAELNLIKTILRSRC